MTLSYCHFFSFFYYFFNSFNFTNEIFNSFIQMFFFLL